MTRGRAPGGGGVDLASALYLGMRHPWAALGPWGSFTTGAPAALAEVPGAEATARRLARLQGCQAAVLLPSTLHLFWDLFALLAPRAGVLLLDRGSYAVARWGAERAKCAGVPARAFAHHSPGALRRAIRAGRPRPVVVCDGFCPECGRLAPLDEYLALVRSAGGVLVVDDTQALGIFGADASADAPYGHGGGGAARHLGIGGPGLVIGASLAKGFGAPLAALSGPREIVDQFVSTSATRVHCSPPSVPAVRAAARALAINRARGDRLRASLSAAVAGFGQMLGERGFGVSGGIFPVQSLRCADAERIHARLADEGVRAVLRAAPGPTLTFVLRADHDQPQLARAAALVARAARTINRKPSPCHT